MSTSNIALRVRGLAKSYTIEHNETNHSTLAETMIEKLKPFRRRRQRESFWALEDISFDIEEGDVIGVIGRNGAGKSTLLKILSRITEPTRGVIDLYGRVGSLLEVGTGFHPELTGRENVYLNGAILGMSKNEIRRQFDAIVEFSGVEKFLDTPVKRYSSGMYVRLAFAVAAHLSTEILLVDEVLAVGDVEFQEKCLGKIKDVSQSGRTVIFVSHHMQSVSVLCKKAMFLERGRMAYFGEVPTAIDHYVRSFTRKAAALSDARRRPGSGEFRFTAVEPAKEYFTSGEEKKINITIRRFAPFVGKYFVSCMLVNALGVPILHCDSRMTGYWIDSSDEYQGVFTLKTPWLKPGEYRVDLFLCSAGIIDNFEHACHLNILPLLPYPVTDNSEATAHGVVFADFGFAGACEPMPDQRQEDAVLV